MRSNYRKRIYLPLLTVLIVLLAACQEDAPPVFIVRLIADNKEQVYQHSEPITVEQFLDEVDVTLGPLDRINPSLWTQLADGMIIRIRRVTETEECEEVSIPYRQETVLVEGIEPGEQRIGKTGVNGREQVCYRTRIEDGEVVSQTETSRITLLAPENEIIYMGPTEDLEPVQIIGTLAYISNRNAWIMRGTSTSKRPLTGTGDLDERIFSLSEDGKKLIYARERLSDDQSGNQLWLIPDITLENTSPLQLTPQDVLFAEWVPNSTNTISYSSFEPRDTAPGWQANNDLLTMRIDPNTGDHIGIDEVLPDSTGGLFGWWGTQFKWSPDGEKLAWIRADGVGLVDLENNTIGDALLQYAVLSPLQDWSWRTTVSWSPDSSLLATTVHGAPLSNERAENSPVFDIAISAADGTFSAPLVERAGIWSKPVFSPEFTRTGQQFPQGYIAYLKARDWDESIRGEYDLVVADRDGSNAQVVFPAANQPGLDAQVGDLAWSPDARQIAFIYLGNLWIVDVETGLSHQLTQDSGASRPIWSR